MNWSVAATILFVIVELTAGLRAGSLALISDAGHNFTDALSLVLAAIGLYLESRPADSVKTYGYQRAGVLTAFINALTLVGISIFIFYEAWQRFFHPRAVEEWTMFWVALAAVALNGGIMWSLHRDKDRDLNIRAAFMHMLGDAISSMAIVAGALLIYFTGLNIIDPILSVLIGALIIWTAWDIIKESLNVLLEGPASRNGTGRGDTGVAWRRGSDRRARFAYLEPGIERPRTQLPRADSGHAAFGEQFHSPAD